MNNMTWYENLYIGENVKKRAPRVIRALKRGKSAVRAYVIALASNPANLLDLYPAFVLRQEHFQTERLSIVGIAADKEEAMEVAAVIVEETLCCTGSTDVRKYLKMEEER